MTVTIRVRDARIDGTWIDYSLPFYSLLSHCRNMRYMLAKVSGVVGRDTVYARVIGIDWPE
jgi:hypothetical protein